MDLAVTLKESISDLHRRIELTPYAQAIVAATIGPKDYARSLVQFLQIHEALEEELAAYPDLPCYDPSSMARARSLRRDIAWWGGPMNDPPLAGTSRLRSAFAEWGQENARLLLGPLYVLEGSRMGSMILAGALSRALGVPAAPGMGLDYHVEGLADRPRAWRGFRESLTTSDLSEEESAGIVAAAVKTMALLHDLYDALPADEVRRELGATG